MSIKSRGSVQERLTEMIAVERHIGEVLSQAQEQVTEHNEVAAALKRFQDMVKGQQAALEARLQSLGGMPADVSGHMEDEAISSVLLSLYAVFSQATLGYAMLHVIAHRFYDCPKEGSTADLAEKHLKNYVQAVNVINQLVSDVVARELDESGEELPKNV